MYCFENTNFGALLFVQNQITFDLSDCAKQWISDSCSGRYMVNLLNILKSYEEKRIRILPLSSFELGCNAEDATIPLILNPGILYQDNDKLYHDFYKKKTKIIAKDKETAKNIISLYTSEDLQIVNHFLSCSEFDIKPFVLNAYAFIYIFKEVVSTIDVNMENSSSIKYQIVDSLRELLKKYLVEIERKEMLMLISEDMRPIYEHLNCLLTEEEALRKPSLSPVPSPKLPSQMNATSRKSSTSSNTSPRKRSSSQTKVEFLLEIRKIQPYSPPSIPGSYVSTR